LFDPLVFPIFVVFCQVLAGTGIVRLAGDIQVALAVYRYGAGSGEACNGFLPDEIACSVVFQDDRV